MKRLFLLTLTALSLQASAQISLEHSYNAYFVNAFNLGNDGYKYAYGDSSTRNVMIYNEDHSLYKTCSTDVPGAAGDFYPRYVSNGLFDSDNGVEFSITYTVNIGGSLVTTTKIYNDDGSVILTLNNCGGINVIEVGSSWKMIANMYVNGIKSGNVYSLPGQWLGILPPKGAEGAESSIYPNPVEDAATISYSLPTGSNEGVLSVYDISGSLKRTYSVTAQFSDIRVFRNELPAGVYFYKITGNGFASDSQRFVIK